MGEFHLENERARPRALNFLPLFFVGAEPNPFSKRKHSPSPRPSPPRRGRRFRSRSTESPLSDCSSGAKWFTPSLSERERAACVCRHGRQGVGVYFDCIVTAKGLASSQSPYTAASDSSNDHT